MDDMSRLNRIEEFWNWLPAFRAVAETEHVGEASEKVHKSPSALSRAVSLLEEDFGVDLFERDGRQIKLTDAGREFLDIVRKSMRLVDEGLRRVAESGSSRDFYVATTPRLSWMLEATAGPLAASLEAADLHVETTAAAAPREQLLQGDIDLLVTHEPIDDENIETTLITELENQIYGREDHPLFHERASDAASPENFEYAAPDARDSDFPPDGWPRELDRIVRCRVENPRVAARLAAQSDVLTVLPNRFVGLLDETGRPPATFESDRLLNTPVFAARRVQLVTDDLASTAISNLSSHFPFARRDDDG